MPKARRADLKAVRAALPHRADIKSKLALRTFARGETMIFMFEMGDFSAVQKSADLVEGLNSTLLNSVRYNQVDWMIVAKKGRV